MRSTRVRRMAWYGAALALLLVVSTPGISSDLGANVALAQDTGQPSTGDERDGGQDAGQTPVPSPGPSPETMPGPGQQAGNQQPRTRPVTVLEDIVLPSGGQWGSRSDEGGEGDEGDDIGEGLSNQRVDPDD